MTFLVTGGCGFLGANLAAEAIRRGGRVIVADNLSRGGADRNLAWLRSLGTVDFVHLDVRLANDVSRVMAAARPSCIFHVAGQVAMTTSLADPRRDFEINALGTLNLLEAVRQHCAEAVVLYSSTNKVYGDLPTLRYEEKETRHIAVDYPAGFAESLPLEFCSPYGCSKGAADQYMLDYARVFGLQTAVFRHSSICGSRQFSTFDQGWVGWFVRQAIATRRGELAEPFTISGDGKQVRDVLFVDDIVRCYFDAARNVDRVRGQAFNIGGGMKNSLSLLELFARLEERCGVRLSFRRLPWRESDQRVFVADTAKAAERFGWEPRIGLDEGLDVMIEWVSGHG